MFITLWDVKEPTLFSVFTWRHSRHVCAPKQRHGGHVCVPTKSSGNLTLLLCKRFLLFSLKNMAVDHVNVNQQFATSRAWVPGVVVCLLYSLFPVTLIDPRRSTIVEHFVSYGWLSMVFVHGAHYPELPSVLYPWVNPVPYLSIFRTTTFWRMWRMWLRAYVKWFTYVTYVCDVINGWP